MFGLAAATWLGILTCEIQRGARSSLPGSALFRRAFRLDVRQLQVQLPPGKSGRSDAFYFVPSASGS